MPMPYTVYVWGGGRGAASRVGVSVCPRVCEVSRVPVACRCVV